jgi:hypothetical protein
MNASPAARERELIDATPFIQGQNLWSSHYVVPDYALILDRVEAEALAQGALTQTQIDASVPAAFATDDGCLFLCRYLPGDPPCVFGTSVPRGSWGIRP